MTEKKNKVIENIYSIAKAVLNFLVKLCKKIKHILGICIVDKLMRSVVAWYDKTHPESARKMKQDNLQIQKLLGQIKELETARSEFDKNLAFEKENSVLLSQKIISLTEKLEKSQGEVVNAKSCICELEKELVGVKEQNVHLLSRCLPESKIPSMIYYAEGDAMGLNLRKVSTQQTPYAIYKIITTPGDTSSAEFLPIVSSNEKEIITNRNATLVACEILSIAPNATSICLVESGRAKIENGKWIVTNKAKIQLI